MEVASQQNLFDLGLPESLEIERKGSKNYLELVELNTKKPKSKFNVKGETKEELIQGVLELLLGQSKIEDYALTSILKIDTLLGNTSDIQQYLLDTDKQISKLVKSIDKLAKRVDLLTSELDSKVKFLEQLPSADTIITIRQLRTNGLLVGEIAKKLNDAGIYTTAGTVWTSELVEYILKESNNRNKVK